MTLDVSKKVLKEAVNSIQSQMQKQSPLLRLGQGFPSSTDVQSFALLRESSYFTFCNTGGAEGRAPAAILPCFLYRQLRKRTGRALPGAIPDQSHSSTSL